MEWWQHSNIDSATFSELKGAEGRSFLSAWDNSGQYVRERIWDDLLEKEVKYYLEDIQETLGRLQERYEFSDATYQSALSSDDPLEELKKLLLPLKDDDYEESGIDDNPRQENDHGLIEDDDEIDNWLNEEASFSLETMFDEDFKNSRSDMEVARMLGLTEINKESFLYALSQKLKAENKWEEAEEFENLLLAQSISPEKIETNYSSYPTDEILGFCTSCNSPITKDDFGKENKEGVCRHCGEPIDLRLCFLMFMFITGRFFVAPKIFCDPKYHWILWPIEMKAKYADRDVVG